MLYSLNWLQQGKTFPPSGEQNRLERYQQNAQLFDNDHFDNGYFRSRSGIDSSTVRLYDVCCRRIERVVGNFSDVISIPVLLNYQRFISLKMADLVCGEHPSITGSTPAENAKLKWAVDNTNLFAQLYAAVIDISRYGDCPIRIYKDALTDYYKFTIWDAKGWFPVVSQDGTNTITHHCLVWLENREPDEQKSPDWFLHAQVHEVSNPGTYRYLMFHNRAVMNVIGRKIVDEERDTGLDVCAVLNVRAYEVSSTVYGYDDYVPLDALLSEIIVRVSQISSVLDKHADPAMTGPISMLAVDPVTGERYLQRGKFFGIADGDTPPSYMTWDGRLDAAFSQLEFLIDQLYILSEMGAALAGGVNDSGNAVSGSAMRMKMVNPLSKARRVSNSLTLPIRKILSAICSSLPEIDEETGEPGESKDTPLPFGHISVKWKDGLPDDPREQLDLVKLSSGEQKILPLEDSLVSYLDMSSATALDIVQRVRQQAEEEAKASMEREVAKSTAMAVNKPGPQDGTGVNPQKKGNKGLGQFQSANNQKQSKE